MLTLKIRYDGGISKPYSHFTPSVDEVIFFFDPDSRVVSLAAENDQRTYKVDSDRFSEIWDELLAVNLTEVFRENIGHIGLDGFTLHISFGDMQNETSVSLWCPSVPHYRICGCEASGHLLAGVCAALKLAEELGVIHSFLC